MAKSLEQTEVFSACRVNKDTRAFMDKRKKELGFKKNSHKSYITHLLILDGLPHNAKGV